MNREWYEMCYRSKLTELDGTSFETFFQEVMVQIHKKDFTNAMPWGSLGDRGNDGYLVTEKTLFQCYSPYNIKAATTIQKITTDFEKSKQYWGDHINKWVLMLGGPRVSNDVPTSVLKHLLDLKEKYKGDIEIEWWSTQLLRNNILSLPEEKLALLFKQPPSTEKIYSIRVEDIEPVLHQLKGISLMMPSSLEEDLTPVPINKIQLNKLNDIAENYIKSGSKRAALIDKYIELSGDDNEFTELASKVNAEYQNLKKKYPQDPNVIFMRLLTYTRYDQANTDKDQAVYLTILAYLFNSCSIFEREL
ncbi:ABC-three component system protein [Sporosarcina psychrophila]|uniref:ABC-three component system protein n=1 Tax=Sporosarcina psychrophila TaxID=1476 RepID=UPI0030CF60A1